MKATEHSKQYNCKRCSSFSSYTDGGKISCHCLHDQFRDSNKTTFMADVAKSVLDKSGFYLPLYLPYNCCPKGKYNTDYDKWGYLKSCDNCKTNHDACVQHRGLETMFRTEPLATRWSHELSLASRCGKYERDEQVLDDDFSKPPYLAEITDDDIFSLDDHLKKFSVKENYTGELCLVSRGRPDLHMVSLHEDQESSRWCEYNELKKYYKKFNYGRAALDKHNYRPVTENEGCGNCDWMNDQRCICSAGALIETYWTCDRWSQARGI